MIGNLFGILDSEFGEIFSDLLNQFAKLSNSKIVFDHFDEEIQYTIKEIQFLRIISANPGMKNIDIAENLGVTKGMVSKIIKQLEQNADKKTDKQITREQYLNHHCQ